MCDKGDRPIHPFHDSPNVACDSYKEVCPVDDGQRDDKSEPTPTEGEHLSGTKGEVRHEMVWAPESQSLFMDGAVS